MVTVSSWHRDFAGGEGGRVVGGVVEKMMSELGIQGMEALGLQTGKGKEVREPRCLGLATESRL